MKYILIILSLTLFLLGDNINTTVSNNHNSVITIVKEVLGDKAQKEIVDRLAFQIIEHYSKTDEKLDKLLDNQSFVNNLMIQINQYTKKNISLSEQLDKAQKEREEAFSEIRKLKKQNHNVDFKELLQKAEEALRDYNSKKYREILSSYRKNKKNKQLIKNIATTYFLSAKSYAGDFIYDKAQSEIEKAITLDESNGDYLGWHGFILLHTAQYTKALEYLQKSLKIYQEIGDRSGEGATLNNIATIYKVRGDLNTALEYLQKSLKIRQEIGDRSGEGVTLNNISQIYDVRGDLNTALEYLQKSLKIYQEIGDRSGECGTLINIGHIHWERVQNNEAMDIWAKAYLIAKKIEYAQALDVLKSIAEQLGHKEGLMYWERVGGVGE